MGIDQDLVTYLRLAPEFGGTRFGPFEELETRLGANGERCHIVLAESLGVLPEHVKLIRQRDGSLILAPAERTATAFLWRPGANRPTQVYTPTAVRVGDAFSLVTPDGPRFVIELDELPPEVKEEREAAKRVATGRRRLSAASMGKEVKRQAWTRLLVMGPMQMVQRAWLYVKSGAIYQPRNIILGVTILGGYMFGGVTMCRSSGMRKQFVAKETELQSCNQQIAFANSLTGSSTEFKFTQLAGVITNNARLGTALEEDSTLRDAVKKKAKNLLLNPKAWSWLIDPKTKKAGEFAQWRERIQKEDKFDADTARLLVWLAAYQGDRSDFISVEDSETAKVCGRGVTKMSYRQALHFGLNAVPDALLVPGKDSDAINENKEAREAALLRTIQGAGGTALPEGQIESITDTVSQGAFYCLYLQGEDERTLMGKTVSTLVKQLGSDGRMLPPDTLSWSPAARIAKYWAADVITSDYSQSGGGIDFSAAPVGPVLEGYGSAGKWVMEKTAETLAYSIAVPCMAILNGDAKAVGGILGEENLPNPVNCLILDWKLRNEG